MTAAQVLACLKRLDSATLRAAEARTRDPRHLFVLTLIDEIQSRSLEACRDGVTPASQPTRPSLARP